MDPGDLNDPSRMVDMFTKVLVLERYIVKGNDHISLQTHEDISRDFICAGIADYTMVNLPWALSFLIVERSEVNA
jgi:hypothetical protein